MSLVENINNLEEKLKSTTNKINDISYQLESDSIYIEKYQKELFDLMKYMTEKNLVDFNFKKENVEIFGHIGSGSNFRCKSPLNITYSTLNSKITIYVGENMLERESNKEKVFIYVGVLGFELIENFKPNLTDEQKYEERKILLNCFKETMNNIDELKQEAEKSMMDFLSMELKRYENNSIKDDVALLDSFILKVEDYKKERI